MIEIVRYTQGNVKRWHDGDMRKRWTAAGMLEAEQQFRRMVGYRDYRLTVNPRIAAEVARQSGHPQSWVWPQEF
jgi:hypothetical protein